MRRPTNEEIDLALNSLTASNAAKILALAVHALREELTTDALNEALECQRAENAKLRATIARVEALPAKWRKDATELSPKNAVKSINAQCFINAATSEFAKELEAALK